MRNENVKDSLKLTLLSLLMGGLCGGIGWLFAWVITQVTNLRIRHGWLICLLPVAGLLVVWLYRRFKVSGVGTNQVLTAADGGKELSPWITPVIFLTSAVSHLCGASVGREGAALQLGGGLASALGKLFRLTPRQTQILLRVGMAGVFSAVFGTPLAAFFFALEVVCVGGISWLSVIPCVVGSFGAYGVAHLLGAHAERFCLEILPAVSLTTVAQMAVLTAACVVVGIGFCHLLHAGEHGFAKLIRCEYGRILVGGVALVALTALVGSQTYNGAGVSVIEQVFEEGAVRPEAFALKMLFTCISVACGYKGGEIVPTLFIGATLGALVATLVGLPVAFGAALGMIALFCCVTNCPLGSLFLAAELFSFGGFWYFLPVVAAVFAVSGKTGLYHTQKRKVLNF